VELALGSEDLFRVNRHSLVRIKAILGLKPSDAERILVRLMDGQELEASRTAAPRLKALVGLGRGKLAETSSC
jgi:two-component system LytT family response regulator/two-component system response regulator AlgR